MTTIQVHAGDKDNMTSERWYGLAAYWKSLCPVLVKPAGIYVMSARVDVIDDTKGKIVFKAVHEEEKGEYDDDNDIHDVSSEPFERSSRFIVNKVEEGAIAFEISDFLEVALPPAPNAAVLEEAHSIIEEAREHIAVLRKRMGVLGKRKARDNEIEHVELDE